MDANDLQLLAALRRARRANVRADGHAATQQTNARARAAFDACWTAGLRLVGGAWTRPEVP